MPALAPTSYYAEIAWLGMVPSGEGLRATQADALELTYAGATGEDHSGLTRASCVRVSAQWPQGTEIRNVRQLSVLSAEEIKLIAAGCGLDTIDPQLLGASLVLRGIPDFTHVPPSSRLIAENGTAIVVDMANRPCIYPGKEIERDHPGHGKAFKAAAKGMRGVTAWVEKPGVLRVGDRLRLHVPDQPVWQSQASMALKTTDETDDSVGENVAIAARRGPVSV